MSDRYVLQFTVRVYKDLNKLQNKQFVQVAKKIFSLSTDPKPQGFRHLLGYPNGYRVACGEYRILYTINEDFKTVDIFRIGKRNDGEVYRNL